MPPGTNAQPFQPSLLVVFDIDETLIQFMKSKYADLFEKGKEKIDSSEIEGQIKKYVKDGNNMILFRPHLEEMLNLAKTDTFYKFAMWTYSDPEYADAIKRILTAEFGLPADFFLFVWSDAEMDDDYPKNMTQIWNKFPQYNKFNTVLVDDRYGNMSHSYNHENGIFIQPYAPFGAEGEREELDETRLRDDTFVGVIEFLKAVKKDIKGCTKAEYLEALKVESVVNAKRLKRMGFLNKYKKMCVKTVNSLFIGEKPHQTAKYHLIQGGRVRGGRKTKSRRRGNKTARRS